MTINKPRVERELPRDAVRGLVRGAGEAGQRGPRPRARPEAEEGGQTRDRRPREPGQRRHGEAEAGRQQRRPEAGPHTRALGLVERLEAGELVLEAGGGVGAGPVHRGGGRGRGLGRGH